ncbi:hypothetical protein SF123566_1849, partial [Shigella flexneri 1235-66]
MLIIFWPLLLAKKALNHHNQHRIWLFQFPFYLPDGGY